jgi:divalent metal cation (Fe/Co/Zn/Cd) transporter
MFRMIFFTLYLLIGVWYAYQITYIADSYICFGIAMAIMYVAYRVAVPFSKEVALEFGKYILYGLSYDDK